jgi:hypothetical protein
VQIEVQHTDIANAHAVKELIQKFGHAWPSLKGIIHAAGVLDDGTFQSQNWGRFEKVFEPKVKGGWNLHEASLSIPLDLFVLFSSVASIIGSPGQSNYAAASAFLDGLAHYRRKKGLPALSISWGAWGKVGMAAGISDRLRKSGWISMAPKQGIEALELACRQVEEHLVIANIDWKLFLKKNPPHSPWLSKFAPAQEINGEPRTLYQQLQGADESQRKDVLRNYLQRLKQQARS